MIAQETAVEANKRIALKFLELSYANQAQEAMKLLAPDATWWVLGAPERLKVSGVKTRAQIERLLGSVHRMMPTGMLATFKGITAEGDRVAVEVEADGTTANGKNYHNSYHFLFQLRDGEIVAVREYMDTLHLFDVLQP